MTRKCPVEGKAWQHISLRERFYASFSKDKRTECWNWINVGAQGYGGIDAEGKTTAAHRVSWILHRGAIPKGLCVLHKCDNRACVNPKHLYLGDKKQNRKDFMLRHPKATEIVENGHAAAILGVKRFWKSMSSEERQEFCNRRRNKQMEKNGGHGARWKGSQR